jgi:hypothetical protein
MRGHLFSVVVAILMFGCAEEEVDEAGAQALWNKLSASGYQSWARAPGYETPQPTTRAHGETAVVFVNDVVTAALAGSNLTAWPDGSLLVKDSFKGDAHSLVAALEKQGKSWFFAEWSANGSVKYAGTPDVCLKCHTDENDFVRAVDLP